MQALVISLQALHLLFVVFWFGSLLYTELLAWPELRKAGLLTDVQTQLRSPRVRRLLAIPIFGTIITGYARGVAGGVFDRLYTLHGLFFVLAAFAGVSMVAWWANFPPRTMKTAWRLFYASFWVVFALMIGLRFTA